MHHEDNFGNLLKVIWHDGQGACLFTKRLERGRAEPGRRGGDDLIGATRISAVQHRLETPTGDVPPHIGRLTLLACGWRWM